MKKWIAVAAVLLGMAPVAGAQPLMNQAKDMSRDYVDMSATYFFAEGLKDFDAARGTGKVQWGRYSLEPRQAFNTNTVVMDKLPMKDFPESGYENDPLYDFQVEFLSDRAVRIRMLTSLVPPKEVGELMLSEEFLARGPQAAWTCTETENEVTYSGPNGSLTIVRRPWRLILRDASGKVLTQTWAREDDEVTQVKVLPFGFRKSGTDNSRRLNPVFSLKAGERIYGCGESPTGLNKAGQKVNLFVTDPQGPETDEMYKPVPFWFSNRGYGVFLHTSAPVTCDFGATYVGATKLFMADEALDLFLFLGTPAQILDEYTDVVGKTPMPPTWSFGTWMSRITYFSQEDGYEIAARLRENRIPADVIHFDTGWFGVDWQCDYKFAEDRFPDPAKMIRDLKDQGFHISLWQLPYFTQHNAFYPELIEKNLVVRNADGSLPYEDACLDFTNPEAVRWYQDKLRGLLEMGVGAIKVDFGEGAPYDGFYANGRGGLYEHNLYPLRYNKAVWEVTKEVQGADGAIIWARSAWAGSQRYPLHWGGDAANTNEAMLSTLHAGLSFGLSGFPFWSHDIGGFVQSTPEDLYRRWLPFGFLSSHTRSHGAPPTEPWLYNAAFTEYYRASAEMKYALMPYILEQARRCTQTGLPMVRALFLEYPDDPTAWLVEDQYLFGSDILVAPIFDAPEDIAGVTPAPDPSKTTGLRRWTRQVYLPGGAWVDYQTGKTYKAGWNEIATDKLEAVILVRKGAVIPTARVAQSTRDIDWSSVRQVKY
ncbi:MAG: alpha-xylosidase [Bacteroidales bacterium]|nr:alpha-xylosidase [Bacteroidales bacterium]